MCEPSDVKYLFLFRFLFFHLFLWLTPTVLLSQTATVFGTITDSLNNPIPTASISVRELSSGTTSDSLGNFSLNLPATEELTIDFQHVSYQDHFLKILLQPDENKQLKVVMSLRTRILDSLTVISTISGDIREQVSVFALTPKSFEHIPSPFNDINQVLATLPGVISNNELSGSYSVRGGNFDENLVYVNDIPVYRPFLIRSGEQEGLSFINPEMTREVLFSSGGWQPEYGDALSSSLNVNYKTPDKFGGSLSIGLLGGSLSLGGSTADDRLSYMVGVRHKRSEYLLNTLETEGEYFPRFTDIQSFINMKLSDKTVNKLPKTELGILLAYARNRYNVEPSSRETSFGTFNQPLKVFVAFIGQELLNYNTYQGAFKLTHRFNKQFTSKLIFSNYYTQEREYFDIEAGYRICDVDTRQESETFNKCINIRGIGTDFSSARNRLNASIINTELRNEIEINDQNKLKVGIGYAYQYFDDHVYEYGFIDSADYVTITGSIQEDNTTNGNVLTGYIQHMLNINPRNYIVYGVRINYLNLNNNLLISPRLQYSYIPVWRQDVLFRMALGLYQQQPFYREFRRFDGSLNLQLDAQKSYHAIAGMDYNFMIWNRPFKLMLEAYYKYLENIIPYDIHNVRIRYFADNLATGYATGLDLRISGEFVPGDESWFSLGILSTKEDLSIDNRGNIPRPSDQLFSFNIFFQDHIPRYPTYRVYLNFSYTSALPFGPPESLEYRNYFRGESFHRADIGLSKIFLLEQNKALNSVWLGFEILNLTGRNNIISYYWVQDFNNINYAVPNGLSGRFFNVKIKLDF